MALNLWLTCTDRNGKPLPMHLRPKCNQYRALHGKEPLPLQTSTIQPTEPNSIAHAEKFTKNRENTQPNPQNQNCDDGPVTPPGIVKKAVNYAAAVTKWIAAGQPVRSEERILQILHEHCEQCIHYQGGRCNVCGCECNDKTAGLQNKLAMANQKCPKGKWE